MAFDPTISTGNVITVAAILASCLVFAVRRSFDLGEFKIQFDALTRDVGEIKAYINDQRKEEISRLKASNSDATSDQLMRYRQDLLEREVQRCRANIHKVAQAVQVRLLTMDEVDTDDRNHP